MNYQKLIAGLLIVVGLAAHTQRAEAQTYIDACYVEKTGVIYLIDPGETLPGNLPRACTKPDKHILFNWVDGEGADHASLANLTLGDPHTQYLPVDGSRGMTGNLLANSRIGIGLSAPPTAPLTIQPINGADIRFASGQWNADILASNEFRVGTDKGFPFSVLTDNQFRLTVRETGKVGIGTFDPQQMLSVVGEIESTGESGGFRFPDGSLQTTAASVGDGQFESLSVTGDLSVGGTGSVVSDLDVGGSLNVLTGDGNVAGDVSVGGVLDVVAGLNVSGGDGAIGGNLTVAGALNATSITGVAPAASNGEAVPYEQAVKVGDLAGGDLAGIFPDPTVAGLQGVSVSSAAPTSGQVLTYDGAEWAPRAPGGVALKQKIEFDIIELPRAEWTSLEYSPEYCDANGGGTICDVEAYPLTLSVECPAGSVLTGGGARLGGIDLEETIWPWLRSAAFGNVQVIENGPSNVIPGRGWTATAYDARSPYTSKYPDQYPSALFFVYAVCLSL